MLNPASERSPPPVMTASRKVLVADDDASTREFLTAALKMLGYTTIPAVDGRDALESAIRERFDILLLDCRMPGAGAIEVLSSLRAHAHAASRQAVAFATSAEIAPAQRQALLAAGFAGILEKPCRVATLGQVLASAMNTVADADAKRLDDNEAIQATGDARTMHALRGLFRQELAQLDGEIEALPPDALLDRLHRLRSGCGFCGATRLNQQVRLLQTHIETHPETRGEAMTTFRTELKATMTALELASA
ncbi:hypothetical protein GCM10009552_12330 [Rothia nasimurium]